ncbi:MAG: hypothetical protein JJD92_11465 [Frankiaceae bacterium]|nr:hypothetical protein [Frankiaceae bacterium]
MRACGVLLLLLLSACNVGRSPSDPVTAEQMAALHADLKSRQFPEHFGPRPGANVTGCAERRLGAERSGGLTVVYLRVHCGWWPTRCEVSTAESAGESVPAVAHLQGVKVQRWQFPGDGDLYSRDINAWFPKSLRDAATFPGNSFVDAMQRAARQDAGCSG